jgi:hypothetical protein
LVSAALVKEGAGVLKDIDAGALFAQDESWYIYHYEEWKRLYLEAAEQSELLLVGVC